MIGYAAEGLVLVLTGAAGIGYLHRQKCFSSTKREIIFAAVMTVILLGVWAALHSLYPDNFWLANMRLLFVAAVLWPVALRDLQEHIIPNKIVAAGCIFWLFTIAVQLFVLTETVFASFLNSIIAAAGIFVVCLLCMLIARGSVGMGDAKLLFMMGLLQGINGLFSAVFFSLIVSFVEACILLITKKRTRKDGMSFGPAVLVGTTISIMLAGM